MLRFLIKLYYLSANKKMNFFSTNKSAINLAQSQAKAMVLRTVMKIPMHTNRNLKYYFLVRWSCKARFLLSIKYRLWLITDTRHEIFSSTIYANGFHHFSSTKLNIRWLYISCEVEPTCLTKFLMVSCNGLFCSSCLY